MYSKSNRLDRYISTETGINKRDVRLILAQRRIYVDGKPASSITQIIGQFTHVTMDQKILQAKQPVYLMMNKPKGVVSATRDTLHSTVIDLVDRSDSYELHIAGRLDFNSSGLLLLTNDGRWSRKLSAPTQKVPKVYRVTLDKPIAPETVEAFSQGIYFPFEDLVTQPATLKIINDHVAEVTLMEGRYHQIKRMFGRFNNPVTALHRQSIGSITLDNKLAPGEHRELSDIEIDL